MVPIYLCPVSVQLLRGSSRNLEGQSENHLQLYSSCGGLLVRLLFSHKEMKMLQLQFSTHPAPWEQLRKHLVCACLKLCLLLRIGQGSRTQWDHGDSWCPSTQTAHTYTCTQTHMYRHTSSPTQTHAKMYNFTHTDTHICTDTQDHSHIHTHT